MQDSQPFDTHKLYRYYEKYNSLRLGYLFIFLIILFVRLCVGVGSYSGMNKPPMFGDYEAQRHWMEITTNLPINEWYEETENNDLEYWGLDYPPLTAYHSWICGEIAKRVNLEKLIELNTSHGIETYDTKFYMRMTVIISDIIFFISAVFTFFNIAYPTQKSNVPITAIFCVLINPLFIIIDHGHFQYNCIALGLTLWSINAMFMNYYYIGSILFVMAICFKQMTLFYALPFFFYCIGISFKQHKHKKHAFFKIFMFGIIVIITFIIIFLPWISLSDTSRFLQVIHRIFPFERGLFEDKVANFWCCTNIVIKWREIFGMKYTKIFALFATLIGCLPCSLLIFKPTPKFFLYSLCISSLSFFLFSYQVHEKNIMFPLMPISLFILEAPSFIGSITWIAVFSMLPLLKKDGLIYFYWSLMLLWYAVTSWIQPLNSMQYKKHDIGRWRRYKNVSPFHYVPLFWRYQPYVSILIHFMTYNVEWTDKYPDIGTYIIMMYCCAHFSFTWILFVLQFLLEYFDYFTDDIQLCHKPIKHKKP